MLSRLKIVSLLTALLLAGAAVAQAPASAPAGSTGLCRDGSYWTGATKKGAATAIRACRTGTAAPLRQLARRRRLRHLRRAPRARRRPPRHPRARRRPLRPRHLGRQEELLAGRHRGSGRRGRQGLGQQLEQGLSLPDRSMVWKDQERQLMSEADAIAQGNRADHGKASANNLLVRERGYPRSHTPIVHRRTASRGRSSSFEPHTCKRDLMKSSTLFLSLCGLAPIMAFADDPPPPPQDVWTGKGQAGYTFLIGQFGG